MTGEELGHRESHVRSTRASIAASALIALATMTAHIAARRRRLPSALATR
jgi:hypothetical protein